MNDEKKERFNEEIILLWLKFLWIVIGSAVYVAYKNKLLKREDKIREENNNSEEIEFFFYALASSIIIATFLYIVYF